MRPGLAGPHLLVLILQPSTKNSESQTVILSQQLGWTGLGWAGLGCTGKLKLRKIWEESVVQSVQSERYSELLYTHTSVWKLD